MTGVKFLFRVTLRRHDLVAEVSAVDLVRAAVAELGGKGGGGRPDMAQGGGASVENADAAIAAARQVLGG